MLFCNVISKAVVEFYPGICQLEGECFGEGRGGIICHILYGRSGIRRIICTQTPAENVVPGIKYNTNLAYKYRRKIDPPHLSGNLTL